MSARIPSTQGIDHGIKRILDPIKEMIEVIKGIRGEKIKPLPATATLADVIGKINEVVEKLQK